MSNVHVRYVGLDRNMLVIHLLVTVYSVQSFMGFERWLWLWHRAACCGEGRII